MTIPRPVLPFLGLAALGVGLATTTGMNRPAEASSPSLKLDARTEAALEDLHQEIQRRFHDRNDVDFGFSRVIRPNARIHNDAPVMERRKFFDQADVRPIKDKTGKPSANYEVNDPELGWVSMESLRLRPKMRPETDRERRAIETLLKSEVDVGIYTYGLLGLKETPVRAKGPGYLSRRSTTAPPAADLVKYAEQAWRAKGEDVILTGPNGWHLMAHRVEADGKDCVSCHAHSRGGSPFGPPPGQKLTPLYAVGDDLGLVIIAVRPRDPR